MTIRGIDVSVAQGIVMLSDWRQLAAGGLRFVLAKCGNGNERPDARFMGNLTGARAAGLIVGTYHVGFPLPSDPAHPGRDAVSQATAHYDECKGLGSAEGELPPALDFEWPEPSVWASWGVTAASARAWALAYLDAASRLYGRLPMLYTYPFFWSHVMHGATAEEVAAFAGYPLWWAQYECAKPLPPAAWGTCAIWQRSDGGGKLPSGAPVDENEIADDATFAALRGD